MVGVDRTGAEEEKEFQRGTPGTEERMAEPTGEELWVATAGVTEVVPARGRTHR